ncbi:MAG: hypothetical protein GX557_08750 [Chloroflexi bacterium]|nr:hypothetical protein [Chloroflexota bacterium]
MSPCKPKKVETPKTEEAKEQPCCTTTNDPCCETSEPVKPAPVEEAPAKKRCCRPKKQA